MNLKALHIREAAEYISSRTALKARSRTYYGLRPRYFG